jgi:hypothetical protein
MTTAPLLRAPALGLVVLLAGTAGTAEGADGTDGARAAQLQTKLPLVVVHSDRAIRDDPKTRARVRVIDHSSGVNTVRRPANGYDGWGGIELRGQSSLRFPKKSYGIELRTAAGEKRKAPLLGMPKEDDWVLYAGYNDKTLMRNVVAYEAARRMGGWAARTRFVELVLNGRYQGVYVLMERVEFAKNRIVASKQGLTGRYLLELTLDWQARRKGAHFRTPLKRKAIVYRDPKGEELSARQGAYIRGVVARAERSLYQGARGAWRAHLDEASAVDHLLLQELFRNADAFRASTFLVKGAGAKLALGPIWDMDLAMGNARQYGAHLTSGWYTSGRVWASMLHRDPRFRAALGARWRQLRAEGFREAVLAAVDSSERELRSGPAGRNFRRWPVLNQRLWQNPAARGSFGAEVRHLRRWLDQRMTWLDRATAG